jgi:MYXO-CTERM domain-containing protein
MITTLLLAVASSLAAPIVNGEPATVDDYPMTGALLIDATYHYGDQQSRYAALLCSSTLIAPDVVLLAAHCVDIEVVSGGAIIEDEAALAWSREPDLSEWDLAHSPAGFPADAITPRAWSKHPDYRYDLWNGITGPDLALLFLDEPLVDVSTGWVPTAEEGQQVVVGAEVTVVGWGIDQPVAQPEAGMGGRKVMGSSTLHDVFEDEIAVGDGAEARQCFGDSGGPTFLVLDSVEPDPLRIIGVASQCVSISGCEESGVWNVRVDAYRDWIDQELRDRCADGTRAWCDDPGLPMPPTAEDTGLPGDTGASDAPGGCACSAGSQPARGWLAPLVMLALVGARRRR